MDRVYSRQVPDGAHSAAFKKLAVPMAVVKAQVGTALPLLACNIALIWFLAF